MSWNNEYSITGGWDGRVGCKGSNAMGERSIGQWKWTFNDGSCYIQVNYRIFFPIMEQSRCLI